MQHTAAHTWSAVSGKTSSWYTNAGGIKAYAANGPVSLRAHTDALQLWADQEVTVISVNDEITVSAKTKIELIAGQSSVTLEGGDIEFKTPGQFEAKGALKAFLGGGSAPGYAVPLPEGTLSDDGPYVRAYTLLKTDERAFAGYRYRIMDGKRILLEGKTGFGGETGEVETEQTRVVEAVKTIMREDQRITDDGSAYVAMLDATEPPATDPIPDEYVEQFEEAD